MANIAIKIMIRPGATIRFNHLIDTGPLATISQLMTIAKNENTTIETSDDWESAVISLKIFVDARPNIIARTAHQPNSIKTMTANASLTP